MGAAFLLLHYFDIFRIPFLKLHHSLWMLYPSVSVITCLIVPFGICLRNAILIRLFIVGAIISMILSLINIIQLFGSHSCSCDLKSSNYLTCEVLRYFSNTAFENPFIDLDRVQLPIIDPPSINEDIIEEIITEPFELKTNQEQ